SSPILDRLRERIVGSSRSLMSAMETLARVIPVSGATVLLVGENGTGKEVFARAIHDLGPRSAGPWVAVNVASIPSTVIESTLFGHERGAFTDARERLQGVFESSAGGTLFLDEIGELDIHLQAKLLRVLQERIFRRLGGKEDLAFDGRLVCATNRH